MTIYDWWKILIQNSGITSNRESIICNSKVEMSFLNQVTAKVGKAR